MKRFSNLTPEQRIAQTAAARAARGAPAGTVLLVVRVRVSEELATAVNALTPAERGKILSRYLVAPGTEATIATMTKIRPAAEAILNAHDVETLTTRAAHELTGTLAQAVLAELAAAMTIAGVVYGWPPARVRYDAINNERDAFLGFPATEHDEYHGPFITIWLSEKGLRLSDSRGFGDDVWLDCPAELLQAMALST